MRIRIAVMLSLLVVIGMSIPAAADPQNPPKWEEPFMFDIDFDFPNPCLGEGEEELWWFHGPIYDHVVETPSGNFHLNSLGFVAASTASGFSMPERMVGVDKVNVGPNTFQYNGTAGYVLTNEEGQKLRAQINIHVTVVDGEVVHEKVDGWDFACIGKK